MKREGGSYFVTFRLTGTLPRDVLLRLKQEREQIIALAIAAKRPLTWQEQDELFRWYSHRVDKTLDVGHGDCWLKQPPVADLVVGALRFGDILLTEGGDPDKLGRGTYWQEQLPECIHQNHIFRVRFDLRRFDPAFVAFQIGSPYGKAYFLAHAKQTTGIATINRTVLSKFPLLVPELMQQRNIAAKLEAEKKAAASLAANLSEKFAALDNLPAALLREAFSGRL